MKNKVKKEQKYLWTNFTNKLQNSIRKRVFLKLKYKVILNCLACFLLLTCIGCSSKLLFPLKNGVTQNGDSRSSEPNIIIYAKNYFEVRSSENCVVQKIIIVDSAVSIITKGKYELVYSNLESSFVKKNDRVFKGQIIGKLKADTINYSNYLTLEIKNNQGRQIYIPNFEK